MKSLAWAVLSFVLAPSGPAAAAERSRWELSDIEVYGTERVAPEQLQAKFGEDFRHMLARWGASSVVARKQGEDMRAAIERKARELGEFGYSRLEIIDSGVTEPGAVKGLLLFDFVEKSDMAQRYPFRPEPGKDIKDPSGMLDDWGRYEDAGRRDTLSAGGDLKRAVCPAYFCPEGIGGEEENRYEAKFSERVPGYKQTLLQILREDRVPSRRAHALYLLTYLHDASDVTALVSYGLNDPDVSVREAAVTILNDIAIHRKDVSVPVRDVMRMLDYPTSSDRQRALALMLSVCDNPDYRSLLLGPAAEQVLKLLRTKNPGQRQMAHTLLTVLSAEQHAETDYEAWDKWLWRARQAATKKGGK